MNRLPVVYKLMISKTDFIYHLNIAKHVLFV